MYTVHRTCCCTIHCASSLMIVMKNLWILKTFGAHTAFGVLKIITSDMAIYFAKSFQLFKKNTKENTLTCSWYFQFNIFFSHLIDPIRWIKIFGGSILAVCIKFWFCVGYQIKSWPSLNFFVWVQDSAKLKQLWIFFTP